MYHYRNSALDRAYTRLLKSSKTDAESDRLRVEYAALERYYRVYVQGGIVGSVGSIDTARDVIDNRSYKRDHASQSEYAVACRNAYRRANITLKETPELKVVDLVVCKDQSLEHAGYAIAKKSKRRAILAATERLRSAGHQLAELWGIETAKPIVEGK